MQEASTFFSPTKRTASQLEDTVLAKANSGVIISPDLTIQDGRLTVVRANNADPVFRFKTVPHEDVDRLVRNDYKILFTRGHKGTLISACDPEVRRYLADPGEWSST
jgi:DUF2075 family protein